MYFRTLTALFITLSFCIGCSDPLHTPPTLKQDGDKPDYFEFGFVQICQSNSYSYEATALKIGAFARVNGMKKQPIDNQGKRILIAYTEGEFTRSHLMLEHLEDGKIRIGISSFKGADTPIYKIAKSYDFCTQK